MAIACSPLTPDPPFLSTSAETVLGVLDHDLPSPSPSAYYPYPSYDNDSDSEGEDDEDDDDRNHRVTPHWPSYRHLFESRGYHLDTCNDVRQFYLRYWETGSIQHNVESCAGYRSACREGRDGNELCKDEGLVSPYLTGSASFLPACSQPAFWPWPISSIKLPADLNSPSGIYFTPAFRATIHSRSACSEVNAF